MTATWLVKLSLIVLKGREREALTTGGRETGRERGEGGKRGW